MFKEDVDVDVDVYAQRFRLCVGMACLSHIDNAFPCAARGPTVTRMHATVVTLQRSRLCLPDDHTVRQGRRLDSY